MSNYAFSADSHIVEPPQVFAALERRFGDRGPRIVQDPDWGDFLVTPGVSGRDRFSERNPGVPVGRLGIAGANLDSAETQAQIRQGYAGIPRGIMEPAERVHDQERDGVRFEVLYPSLYFRVFALPDNEVLTAAFQEYNDWLADYAGRAADRMMGLALLPMSDPAAAAVELERAIKLGYKGICIPCTAPAGRPYYDPAFDGVWSLAQEAGLPVGLHIFTGSAEGISGLAGVNSITSYASSAVQIQITLADLICGGVAHRFPRLKFVAAEWEIGWLAHWLQRLDHAFYRNRQAAYPQLNLRPTGYWKRQFYATFEDDKVGVITRNEVGLETLMWGNDYPHHDSIWPNSPQVLDDIFAGVPEANRFAMTVGNVAKLYGLPLAK